MEKPYKLILADDHAIFLEGVKEVLEREPDFQIAFTAKNGEEVINYISKNSVDIVLLDVEMPMMDGIQTTKEIKRRDIDTKVIILSMYDKTGFIKNAITAGADGYLLKNTDSHELKHAVRQVLNGETYFSQKATQKLIGNLRSGTHQQVVKLNQKEIKILTLMAKGLTSKEIGDEACMSVYSVNTYRKNMIDKFDVNNAVQMILEAYKQGYIIV